MSSFDMATRGLKNVFGLDDPAPGRPKIGARPAPPAASIDSSGADAAATSVAAEGRRLEELQQDVFANAYGIDGAVREPGLPTMPQVGAQREELEWDSRRAAAMSRDVEAQREDAAAKMAAHAALAGKFSIVEERTPDLAPNSVTREEYEKVLALYSSIDRGKGDLSIDTKGMPEDQATKFKSETMGDIASLLQTAEGRELLGKLDDNQHPKYRDHLPTTISRLSDEQRKELHRLGDCTPSEVGEIVGGMYVRNPTKVRYDSDAGFLDGGPEGRRDAVLFHELRHALDMTQGTGDRSMVPESSPVAPDAGKVAQIEHQAVGLGDHAHERLTENAFRRARRQIGEANAPGELPQDDATREKKSYRSTMNPRWW